MANPIDLIITKEAQLQLDALIAKLRTSQEEVLKLAQNSLTASKNLSTINTPSGLSNNSSNNANTIASVQQQSKVIVDSQVKIQQAYERSRIAEIKLQQQREKAFDSYDKKIQKQIQLEEKASQKAIAESNKIIAQKEREFAKFEKEFNKYEADLAKKAIAEEKAKKIAVQSALDQSKAFQSLQAQKEKALAAEAKQQQALARSETAYQRIQSSVNLLTKTYQDLAIRRELGGTLTKREEAQLLSLTNRLNTYQTALKKVDAEIQKNQRNVGNYASGWNGLGNSINQITRELPAFTFSAQTGFLALSNNIPTLTDEIGKLQRANKELIAQGQPVKSVFSQILGSVLSLQTAMGIGILLFTMYGKEIGAFVTNLFNFEKALTATSIAQKSMTDSSKEGIRSAQDELSQLKINLGIAKDVTKSYEQRKLAVDTLKQTYPDYLKNISDEAILSGKAEEAVNLLTNAIINNAKAQAAKGRILENETKRLDLLDEEVRLQSELEKQNAKNKQLEPRALAELKSTSDRNIALTQYNDGTAKSLFLERELAKNRNEINKLDEVNNKLSDYAIKNTTLFSTKEAEKSKIEKNSKRQKLEDIKLEQKGVNSLIESLETEIKLITELQNANSTNFGQWTIYQKQIDKLKKAIDNIKNGYEELRKSAEEGIAMAERENASNESKIETLRRLKEETDKFIKSFSDSFLADAGLGSLQQFFDGTFERLMAGADTLKEKFAVTFLAISEVAQEAFNFINQASQQNFDAEYRRLELQKEVAITFAGESTTAQERINTEYDRRKREIQRREAEAQKKMAVFNILINTAQGVVSALASTPPNIPLSIAIGVIGAIQAGIVQGQQIPQFFEGGTHKGGIMMVNDAKGNSYKETIVTPNGKVIKPQGRNVLMNAPAGTEIFTPEQWKEKELSLSNMLSERGVSFNANVMRSFAFNNGTGLSKNDFDNGISQLAKTFKNSPSSQIIFDEKGYRKFTIQKGIRTERLNRRFNIG